MRLEEPQLLVERPRERGQQIGGVGIVSGYGLTECPIISMASVRDPDDKLAHTEGRATPGVELRQVDGHPTRVLVSKTEHGSITEKALPKEFFESAEYRRIVDLGKTLAGLIGGDLDLLTKPIIDSYHTIWFELHEELIALAGRTREAEVAAGRA